MVNTPKKIQELYRTDSVYKNIRISFPNGERSDICNDQIVQDSVRFTESICSRDQIKFGIAEVPMFECEVVHVGNIENAIIHVSIEIQCEERWLELINPGPPPFYWECLGTFRPELQRYVWPIQIGTFVVSSCDRQTDLNHRKIIAYGYGNAQKVNLDLFKNFIKSWYTEGNYYINADTIEMLNKMDYGEWYRHTVAESDLTYQTILRYNGNPIVKLCYYSVTHPDLYYVQSGYSENPYDGYKPTFWRFGEVPHEWNETLNTTHYVTKYSDFYLNLPYLNAEEIIETKNKMLDSLNTVFPNLPANIKEFIAYLCIPHIELIDEPYYERIAETSGYSIVGGSPEGIKNIDGTNYWDLEDDMFQGLSYLPLTSTNFQLLNMNSSALQSNNGLHSKRMKMIVHIPAANFATRYYNDTDHPRWRWYYFGYNWKIRRQDIGYYQADHSYDVEWDNVDYTKLIAYGRVSSNSQSFSRIKRKYNSSGELISKTTVTRTEYHWVNPDREAYLNFAEFYEASLELRGLISYTQRSGKAKVIDIAQNFGLTPAEDLYPGTNRYPQSASGGNILPGDTVSCWYSDKLSIPYGAVKFTYKNENGNSINMLIYINEFGESSKPDTFQTYDFADNYILRDENFTQAQIMSIMEDFINKLAKINYIPVEIKFRGLPYVEAGDTVEIRTNDNDDIFTIIFRRTLTGEQCLFDTIEMR